MNGNLETFSQISPNQFFFSFKNPALRLFYLYSPQTSCKTWEKFSEPFLRKLRYQPTNQPSNANLETFWRISPNQYFFFKNRALQLFYLYSPLTSCKKSEKCLELFLRKLCYQTTNQPITNNTNFIGPGWHRSNKWKNPS